MYDLHQIHKSACHSNIRDIGTPDLIGSRNLYVIEKIRIYPVLNISDAGIGFGVDCGYAQIPSNVPSIWVGQDVDVPCILLLRVLDTFDSLDLPADAVCNIQIVRFPGACTAVSRSTLDVFDSL